MGGEYRQLLTAFVAAAGGNVTGGVGQFVQAAGVNYLQSLGAAKIKEIAASLGGEGSPAHIALHAVLACAGAGAQGANCGAGAIGASASIVISGLLDKLQDDPAGGLTAEDREARANLLTTVLAGVSSALSPEQVTTLVSGARIEAENNTLHDHTAVHTAKFEEKIKGLMACIGDTPCQSAAGHFLGWIKVIDEHDLPACQGETTCVQNKILEREAYVRGYATATARMSDRLIAGMDLLDATPGAKAFDRFKLKDALVRFRDGAPDYTSEVDQFVAKTMSSSLVVFAAVKGLSPLDSDGGGGGGRRAPNNAGEIPKKIDAGGTEVPLIKIKANDAVKGKPEFELLNNPSARAANTRYELDNGNTFKTNKAGQVEEITFVPVNTKKPRDSRQTEAGKLGRDTDVGGHAQACSQGGACDGYNLFPQDKNFNNSAYKVFYENEIRRALNDPTKTVGLTTIKFNRSSPSSPRPDSLSVTYTIDGKARTRIFENEANRIPKDR
ncbi:hypothetical protein LMG3412_06485 [Achromobacter deleyi]|nr:hypothetical protein LMG3412_06485 [Achromobacter deleyi]